MANGKFHDRFNILIGASLISLMLALSISLYFTISFAIGWGIATLIFSPDTDLRPKKRIGPLQFFLYPYSILFKHRGLSHSLLLGTLGRVLYAVVIFIIIIYILNGLGHIEFSMGDFFGFLNKFFRDFDIALPEYQVVLGVYLGMFGADFFHIFIDHITGIFKSIWPF